MMRTRIILTVLLSCVVILAAANYPPILSSSSGLILFPLPGVTQASWGSFSGYYQRTQSQLATLTALLGTANAGLLVNVTDYGHVLRWTGSAWSWGPGETGSGMLVPFAVAPTGSGWHVCDGTSVAYLKADGTTANVTVPNTAGTVAYTKLGASYSGTITAAATPTSNALTFTGNAATLTGTVSQPTFTGSAMGTHQHALPIGIDGINAFIKFDNTTSVPITHTNSFQVAYGGGAGTFGVSFNSDAASAGTPAGTVSQPTVTMNSYTPAGTINTPTITLGGDPVAHFQAILYFRQ